MNITMYDKQINNVLLQINVLKIEYNLLETSVTKLKSFLKASILFFDFKVQR
jgi:hypothetical protein